MPVIHQFRLTDVLWLNNLENMEDPTEGEDVNVAAMFDLSQKKKKKKKKTVDADEGADKANSSR